MRRLLLIVDVVGLCRRTSSRCGSFPVPAPTASTQCGRSSSSPRRCRCGCCSRASTVCTTGTRSGPTTPTVDDIVGVFQLVTLGTWSFLVFTHLSGLPYPNLGRLVVFWLIAVALVPLLRAFARMVGRRQVAYVQNVIIVGSGHVARLLADKIVKHREYGLRVVGFVDRDASFASNGNVASSLLGAPDDLPRLIQENAVDRVVDRLLERLARADARVIRSIQDLDVQIDIVPRHVRGARYERAAPHARGHPARRAAAPLRLSGSSRLLKRSFDVVGAALGLVLLSPLFVAVAASRSSSTRAGPVFFRQVRMGADDRTFRDLQVPHDGRRRGEPGSRRSRTSTCTAATTADVQDPGRSARHARRPLPPPLADRRAAAAPQRRSGRDVARRPAAADPRRGSATSQSWARRRLDLQARASPASGRCSARATSRSTR